MCSCKSLKNLFKHILIAMMSYTIIDSMYENLIIELFNTEQYDLIDNTVYIFIR